MQKWPVLLFVFLSTTACAQVNVQQLRLESQTNPIGIDAINPRFSWQLLSGKRNMLQTAYEIKVALAPGGKNLFWSSGKIVSAESQQVLYSGPALQSAKKYYWQVRIWTTMKRLLPGRTCFLANRIAEPGRLAGKVAEQDVKEGIEPLKNEKGITLKGKEDGYLVVETGSASYHFSTVINKFY